MKKSPDARAEIVLTGRDQRPHPSDATIERELRLAMGQSRRRALDTRATASRTHRPATARSTH